MQRHRWTYPLPPDHAAIQSDTESHLLLTGSETAIMNRLAVIKGFSQLLERVINRDGQHESDLQRIVGYCSILSQEASLSEQLLRQYFAAARLQWDATAIDWHAVDLGRLVQTVATRFESSHPPRGARNLNVEMRDDVQGIWDQRWLSEALAALFSNALKYSPDGSSVHITVRLQDEHAVLDIVDAGSGIVPDEQGQIFEPFVRGFASREQRAQGWGLGLFIASRAIVAHGGWLEIESEPSVGSQFSVHMPLMPRLDTPLSA